MNHIFVSPRPGDTVMLFVSLCKNIRFTLRFSCQDSQLSCPIFSWHLNRYRLPVHSLYPSRPSTSQAFPFMTPVTSVKCISLQSLSDAFYLLPNPSSDVILCTRCFYHYLLYSRVLFQWQNHAFQVKEWTKMEASSLALLFSKSAAWATFSIRPLWYCD